MTSANIGFAVLASLLAALVTSEEGLAAGLSGCGPYHTDGNICGDPPDP